MYPRFFGWITELLKVPGLKQTVLTYLPPIEKPIKSYETIVKVFTGSEQLSKQTNIKQTELTIDVGVVFKEFRVQWNQPEN